jgi:ABC-type polysaccharide/polyol phosphate transport system ATPase subunit
MTRETDIPIYAKIFGLIGANGARKSTLLKLVARVAPLLTMGAGFPMELSWRENLSFNGTLSRVSTGVSHP